MRGRGKVSTIFTVLVLAVVAVCIVSPAMRDRVFGYATDCVSALRQFWQFILGLFGQT